MNTVDLLVLLWAIVAAIGLLSSTVILWVLRTRVHSSEYIQYPAVREQVHEDELAEGIRAAAQIIALALAIGVERNLLLGYAVSIGLVVMNVAIVSTSVLLALKILRVTRIFRRRN